MLGKDTDNKRIDDIDKLVRKRKGGRGRSRLTDSAKMRIILSKLESAKYMDYRPGHSSAQILRFIPRSENWTDTKIIEKLVNGEHIVSREGRADERGEKYFYKTEKGESFRVMLEPTR